MREGEKVDPETMIQLRKNRRIKLLVIFLLFLVMWLRGLINGASTVYMMMSSSFTKMAEIGSAMPEVGSRSPSEEDNGPVEFIYRVHLPDNFTVAENDQFRGSQFLQDTRNPFPRSRVWWENPSLEKLQELVVSAPPSWNNETFKAFFLDNKDLVYPYHLKRFVRQRSGVWGWKHVYLISRSTTGWRKMLRFVEDRNITLYKIRDGSQELGEYQLENIPESYLGIRHNVSHWIGKFTAGVKRFHFTIREDILLALIAEVEKQQQQRRKLLWTQILQKKSEDKVFSDDEALSALLPTVSWHRPLDVAHYWSPGASMAWWRSAVSFAMRALLVPRNISVFADTIGERGRVGRTSANLDYVKSLLQHKIVVVCQRDNYEDHLRLFEALLSGALVMTDPMLDLPPGLVDGESIVVFRGLGDLIKKVLFFLENGEERMKLAKRGLQAALQRNRESHRWEDLLLGDWGDRDDYGVSKLGTWSRYNNRTSKQINDVLRDLK